MERESMDYDVVIVGGGPSGLSTAIRLAQNFKEKNLDKTICVLEKSAEIGAPISALFSSTQIVLSRFFSLKFCASLIAVDSPDGPPPTMTTS